MEKAPVLDSDKVCRIQIPWSVSDRIREAWCVLQQLPAGMDGGCRGEGAGSPSHGAGAAVGLGRSSSLSRDASSPSRGSQWSKTLVASGLSTCPYFFQLVNICLRFFCLLYLRALHPFMKISPTQKNKPGNKQAANAARTKAPPAAQKYQATPTHVFPHPPHQWGGSVAEHGALSVSKPQHPGVGQRKFPTP